MQNITLETLAKTPAFRAALAELEAGQLAERQARIDDWLDFRAKWHAEQIELAARANEAHRQLEEMRGRMLALERETDQATSAARWKATRDLERERRMEAAILAEADARLPQFRAWAERAANLANVATFEQQSVAFAGAAAPAPKARQALEVARLCAEANARADAMRREAIAADAVALELDALAAGILQALDRLGGSAAARLPRDWRGPLI